MDTSVMSDFIDCPQCGLPAQKDDYYVVGEERVVCDYCGYSHIKIGETKQASKGYGSVHYVRVKESDKGSNQETEIIRFNEPLDLSARNNALKKIYESCDLNRSSMFVWNDEDGLEVLHGIKPKTLDECYEEEARRNVDEDAYYRAIQGLYPSSDEVEDF